MDGNNKATGTDPTDNTAPAEEKKFTQKKKLFSIILLTKPFFFSTMFKV